MALEGVLEKLGPVGMAIKSRSADSVFWLCVLAGITPSLMSNLISPIEWAGLASSWPNVAFPLVNDYARLVALLLLGMGGTLAIAGQRRWHMLLLAPLALYAFCNNDTASALYLPSQTAYNVVSALALVGFILSGSSRLRSLYFTAYLVTLILISVVEPLIWGYQIIIFLGFAIVARMAALFVRENVGTFREMGIMRVLQVAGISLLMWLPILLFIVPGQLLTAQLSTFTEDFIYAVEPLSLLGKQRNEAGEIQNPPRNFRTDINAALDITAAIKQAELDAGLAQIGTISEESKGTLPDVGTQVARQALPGDPLIQVPNCSWYNILCHIEAAIKKGINRGYSGIRDRALASMHGELAARANDANANVQVLIADAQNRVVGTVQSVKLSLQTAVVYALRTFDAMSLVLNLLLILAAVKSYLYVFARFAFKPGEKGVVTLKNSDKETKRGTATFYGQRYQIPATNKTDWFYSTRFAVEGRPGKFAVPQWTSAVLSRLFSWNYFMNVAKFGGKPGEVGANNYGAVTFKTSGMMNLVEWEFADAKEEIIFDLDDFVGMSGGVSLSSIVSFRLSTLLLGRIIFHRAQGPGKILLRVRGEAAITSGAKSSLNRPVHLHVAWNRQAEFDVYAERDIINVYLRGVNLSSRSRDLVVVEAGTGDSPVGGGIARFIKSFLLPV